MGEAKQAVMTRDEAEKKIHDWADFLEVDTDRAFFADVVDELVMPVKKGRLDLDYENEVFKYRLIKPIEHQNSTKEIIEIKEGRFGLNKAIERYKDSESTSQAAVLLGKRTGLENAEVELLSDRDITKINAVILGFFVQTKSSR
jgi:hypothetical protein